MSTQGSQLPGLEAYVVLAQDEVKAWVYDRSRDRQFPSGPQVFSGTGVSIGIPAMNIDLPLIDIYDGIEFD